MEIPVELQNVIDPNKECCCIYHFSNKCKEWAYNKGYNLITGFTYESMAWMEEKQYQCEIEKECHKQDIFADTEPEAIFKACEWIQNSIKEREEK